MKALIVVDAQRDFMPATEEEIASEQGGALAVPNGDEIVPVINKLLPKFDLVIFTKDWHPKNNIGFASQHNVKPFEKTINGDTVWPDHCVQDTPGADLHPDINLSLCKKAFYIFKKGETSEEHPYSAFGIQKENDPWGLKNELSLFLDDKNVDEIFICGLATDYCVKETALDSADIYGYKTRVITDACRSIGKSAPVYERMFKSSIKVLESKSV